MNNKSILIICSDDNSINLFSELLPGIRLDFINDPRILQDLDAMVKTINTGDFDILIVTNLGIPIIFTQDYLIMIPTQRKYGVLLVSGVKNQGLTNS